MIAVVAVLGLIGGAALAVNLYLIARGESRMLRDEQQVCQAERQDRGVDRMLAAAAHVHVAIPPAPGC